MALKGKWSGDPGNGLDQHQQLLSTHCGSRHILSLVPAFPHLILAATQEGDAGTLTLEDTKAQRDDMLVCTGVRVPTQVRWPRNPRPSPPPLTTTSPESQGRQMPRGGEEKLRQT